MGKEEGGKESYRPQANIPDEYRKHKFYTKY